VKDREEVAAGRFLLELQVFPTAYAKNTTQESMQIKQNRFVSYFVAIVNNYLLF
jgi:hypothetical protein